MHLPTTILVAVVALAACGRDVVLGDGDPEMTIDDLCRRSTEIRCQANQECCRDDRWVFDSEERCFEDEEAECLIYGGVAFDDGRVTIDAETAESLLGDLERGAAACEELPVAPDVTDRLFVGTQPEGADCTVEGFDISPAIACAEGLYCHFEVRDALTEGTCTQIADPGEPCVPGSEFGSPCTTGHYCGDDGGQFRCVPRLADGTECTESSQCASGYCNECPGGFCEGTARCEEEPEGQGPFCLYVGDELTCTAYEGGGMSPSGSLSCHAEWTCPDAVYRIECALDGTDYACRCLEDTIEIGQFRSAGYCDSDDVDDDTRRAAAESGCGWQIWF